MTIKEFLSLISFIAALILGTIAIWIPPLGIIDDSILWFTALLLIFCSTMLGIHLEIPFKSSITKAPEIR